MGKINVFAKWDLEKGKWVKNPDFKDYGRSFAIASYEKIINNNGKINYIIIDQGSRVEDHSKDFVSIKEKQVRIDNIISHYKKKNENYDVRLFLMDADAPIVEDAKLFAKYIEYLAMLPTTNSINIIGLSKCSVMNFYVPRYFNSIETFNKVNMFNVASPYEGTKMASPLIIYPEAKQLISSKISNEKLASLIYEKLISFYESISSNSHMDYDIAVLGGVPENKRDVYDESFIRDVFCADNVEAIKKLNSFKNIVTGIDSNTLKEALATMNFVGIGLCLLDDVLFDNKSDGFIYTSSQRKVEDVLDIKSTRLKSTHHDVNGNIRAFNDVLSMVDDTIGESEEKKQYTKKFSISDSNN